MFSNWYITSLTDYPVDREDDAEPQDVPRHHPELVPHGPVLPAGQVILLAPDVAVLVRQASRSILVWNVECIYDIIFSGNSMILALLFWRGIWNIHGSIYVDIIDWWRLILFLLFIYTVLTSIKSLNTDDQHQQKKYMEAFHFACFQSEPSCWSWAVVLRCCTGGWACVFSLNWFTVQWRHHFYLELSFICP